MVRYIRKSINLRYEDSYLQWHYIIRSILCMRAINNSLSLLLHIYATNMALENDARIVQIDYHPFQVFVNLHYSHF